MKNRLVMPPLATEKSAGGIVTDDLLEYDSERTEKAKTSSLVQSERCTMRLSI